MKSPPPPFTKPGALTREHSAAYLDMSPDTFDRKVRPYVKRLDLTRPGAVKAYLLWPVSELDRWIAERMCEAPADDLQDAA